jgi:Cys-tRNA(Pro)/Cys-tRNA(Cys) deacylase
MKKTNAVRLLDREGVAYELIEYAYDEADLSAPQIAAENNLPVEAVYKTLVLKGDRNGPLVAVIPGDRSLDMKALAKASGNKKVAMVPVKDIPGLTGYIRGGCSPLGMKKDFPVFLEASALDLPQILVNAGQRGLLMKLQPEALQRVARARVERLCQLA